MNHHLLTDSKGVGFGALGRLTQFEDVVTANKTQEEIEEEQLIEFDHHAEAIAVIFQGIILAGQVATTIYFLIKSRKVPEIKNAPKVIMFLVICSTCCLFSGCLVDATGVDFPQAYLIVSLSRIFDITQYGMMFRFARIQVQLKSQEENSKQIIAAITRSRRLQLFIYVILALYTIALISRATVYSLQLKDDFSKEF